MLYDIIVTIMYVMTRIMITIIEVIMSVIIIISSSSSTSSSRSSSSSSNITCWIRGEHLSNTPCLPQVLFKKANHAAT